jgi:hypothetical protein
VIEEPDVMQCELHESYDFIESYCLTHKIKQLRTEIGFEEKREKLVYSLNQKLIDTIKQNKEFYFKHEGRICADPETSFRVLQSQERSLKSKGVFNQDEREIAVVRDLNSGSRRSTNVSASRIKTSLIEVQENQVLDLMEIEDSQKNEKIDEEEIKLTENEEKL